MMEILHDYILGFCLSVPLLYWGYDSVEAIKKEIPQGIDHKFAIFILSLMSSIVWPVTWFFFLFAVIATLLSIRIKFKVGDE